MKIEKTADLVREALIRNRRARTDDFILYGSVLKTLGVDLANTTLYDFLATAKKLKMPALESVPRARRKLFEQEPELADPETQFYRQQEQGNYKNFSRN